jgi:hypothetical protein
MLSNYLHTIDENQSFCASSSAGQAKSRLDSKQGVLWSSGICARGFLTTHSNPVRIRQICATTE